MIRLDKYLANLGWITRRTAKDTLKSVDILINNHPVSHIEMKVNYGDTLDFGGQKIEIKEFVYIILYKKAGYISSNEDEFGYPSYRALMQDCPYVNLLNVAGRLDQDTEGLLLLSNDGQFIHQVISPKRDKEKEYEVHLENPISDTDITKLEQGVILDDGYHTLPAKAQKLEDKKILLTITEGKFHQVKRMLEAVNNKVTSLKRTRIGDWTLEGLELGEWREVEKF